MRNKAASLQLATLPLLLLAGLLPGQAQDAGSQYAGSDTCGTCHEDLATAFQKNPHYVLEQGDRHNWKGKGCEACHGPGQKHAESTSAADIVNPGKLNPAATDKICLTCHLNQPTHVGRLESSHVRNQVSCIACHKVHATKPSAMTPRAPAVINELCASCHMNVWAKFQQPYHHRLPERAMSCVDCHNPHGTPWPAMQQTFGANEPGCYKCHGYLRGPFTFEHEPVRYESCTICHEPHGSPNPRMLIRQEVSTLCLECHANLPASNSKGTMGVVPPAFHDLRAPQFRNCTVCHQKIHGSYVDRNLLR